MKEQLKKELIKLERLINTSNGVNNLKASYKEQTDSLELLVYKDAVNGDYNNFTVYIYDFQSIDKVYKTLKLMKSIINNYSYNNFNAYKSKVNKLDKAI